MPDSAVAAPTERVSRQAGRSCRAFRRRGPRGRRRAVRPGQGWPRPPGRRRSQRSGGGSRTVPCRSSRRWCAGSRGRTAWTCGSWTGSGPDGLILRADVEYALRAAAPVTRGCPLPRNLSGRPAVGHGPVAPVGAPQSQPGDRAPGPAAAPHGTRIPLRGIRGAVADKLSRSRREIPDATCWVDADATELMHARAAMNAAGGPKISVLALLARICTAALARYPELNSTVDMDAREIVRLDQRAPGFRRADRAGAGRPGRTGRARRATRSR